MNSDSTSWNCYWILMSLSWKTNLMMNLNCCCWMIDWKRKQINWKNSNYWRMSWNWRRRIDYYWSWSWTTGWMRTNSDYWMSWNCSDLNLKSLRNWTQMSWNCSDLNWRSWKK
jgi:hypothetical protein